MPANNALKVTDINFDSIKSNLKTYLSSQSQFNDYDFEGSAMATIIDLLSYNTYMNSVYANFVGNEMFLDSAILRDNIVSRAKMLGYTPRSARGATAYLHVTITPTGSPDSVLIPANTIFTSTVDGLDYKFVTVNGFIANSSASPAYSANVALREGEPLTQRYTVDSSNPVKYLLPNPGADTSSLKVRIQESVSNTSVTPHTLANDLNAVGANSNVFFVQESTEGQYEVLFGDGVLGKAPRDGNIIILDYQVASGSIVNGANTFSGPSTIGGFSNYTFTLSGKAAGGAEAETIDEIKFNAPKNFERQGRAVVAEDYRRILLAEAGDVQTASVWGGEDNDPPIYGKIFIAAKPRVGNLLSAQRKTELVALLNKNNVVSVQPEFVDASFIYVDPTIKINYRSADTTLSASDLFTKVSTAITNFESNTLNDFQTKFRASNFERQLDNADPSFVSNYTTYRMIRRFSPNTNTATTYSIPFNNVIFNPHTGHQGAISSTSFRFQDQDCFIDDNGEGQIRIFYLGANNVKTYISRTAGTVDYNAGIVTINGINITSSTQISIFAKPAVDDVNSVRNQIMLLRGVTVELYDETTGSTTISGSVATAGSTASVLSETVSVVSTGTTSGVPSLVY